MIQHRYVVSAMIAFLLCLVPGVQSTYAADAGITVDPTSGLSTTEGGGTVMFSVVLDSQPSADVTINLTSSNTAEGTVSPSSLTFTSGNWNTSQPVVVTGVDDAVDDGDVVYSILTAAATSGDSSYNGLNAADVSLTNTDDDTTGVTVTPTEGLITTEAGGTATFTIVLNSRPTADVSVPVSSSNAAEGTVNATSVVFTPANWNLPRTLTVKGVNDFVDDGDTAYSIVTGNTVSNDTNYSNKDVADVSVTNTDDDTANVTVTPKTGLVTTESGGTKTFSVVLTSEPTSNVTIALSSSNPAEGTVTPATLTFIPGKGRTAQTVTVKGAQDTSVDGNILFSIVTGNAVSSDANYSDMDVPNVSVTNNDDETIKLSTGAVTVNESAGTASVNVQIVGTLVDGKPVSVAYATNNGTATAGSDYTATSGILNFTAGGATSQTISVPITNDVASESNEAFTIALSAPSGVLLGSPSTASITIPTNDGLSFSLSSVSLQETAATATFTVKLSGANTVQDVTVAYATTDGTATGGSDFTATTGTVTLPKNTLTKTFTVPIINDAANEGDETFSAVLSSPTDASLIAPSTQTVTILANDTATAGINVTALPTLKTTEAGGLVSFKVVLNSQPAANVTIPLSSDDTTEGTVTPTSLVFTTTNWNIAQTVTVKGVNDFVDDGDIAYSIVTAPATSTDSNYEDRDAANVSVTNTDDDTANVTVTPKTGLVTTESGGTKTFSVVLTSEPTSNVTIALSSSNPAEGTVTPATLTFIPGKGRTAQTVTVKGAQDTSVDGNILFSIVTGNAVSSDANYSDKNVPDVAVTNNDDEAVKLSASAITVNESTGTASVTVQVMGTLVDGKPVSVKYATKNGTATAGSDYTDTSGILTFTAAGSTSQTITVPITNDVAGENNETFTIALSTPNGVLLGSPSTASIKIPANDTLAFSPATYSVSESGVSATISVRLNGPSTQSVAVNYATGTGTATVGSDYTAKSGTLLFAPGETMKTFTVAITNDVVKENNETVTLTLSNAVNASLGTSTATLTILAND